MVTNTPEYLIEEVRKQYGVDVPLETAITYLDSDPYLTPESLYDYVSRHESQPVQSIKLKGYKFVDFDKDEISFQPGVYFWLLKDNAELPAIDGIAPTYTLVEVNKKAYRVLYIGQAKTESLYDRVVKKHLRGNPRQSTLCWSLAAIMGKPYTINDKGKPKLDGIYCQQLSSWLRNNCYLLYKEIPNISKIDSEEEKQIRTFTPPVNLDKNPNKATDPYIQSVSKYRHIAGGYKDSSSKRFGFLQIVKYIPYIVLAICGIVLLYYTLYDILW